MTGGWRRLVLVLCACWAAPAPAHRLDEYLQATLVTIGRDQVVLQLRLTPGMAVAGAVLATIDTDADGVLSASEERAYAQQVGDDLELGIDGRRAPLQLVSSRLAPADAMRQGVGDIALVFRADLPIGFSHGDHGLVLEQRHQRGRSVYLVNALVSPDPDVHVTGQRRSADQSRYWLDFTVGGDAAPTGSVEQGQPVIGTFFRHGVHHILTGYDHLLFAAALALAAATFRELLEVVTAFTLAHSATLALATLGWVHLPSAVVEPLIAASIIVVALQNVLWPAASHGRGRLVVAFFFGLFHGLGFAGGLLDLMHQMPRETMLRALVGFSLGIELGHQVVVLPLFVILKAVRGRCLADALPDRVSTVLRRLGSGGIALAGLCHLGATLATNL